MTDIELSNNQIVYALGALGILLLIYSIYSIGYGNGYRYVLNFKDTYIEGSCVCEEEKKIKKNYFGLSSTSISEESNQTQKSSSNYSNYYDR